MCKMCTHTEEVCMYTSTSTIKMDNGKKHNITTYNHTHDMTGTHVNVKNNDYDFLLNFAQIAGTTA